MTILIAGLVVFIGVHVYSAVRSRVPGSDLREKIGYGTYMGLYSLVSAIGLGLIIYGYDAARPAQVLYTPPSWAAHLNYVLMPLALIALAAAYLPTGHIKKMLKHPMLVAVKLWAVGHLLANGELNSVLLFGVFLAYAVFDRIAVKRRGDNGPGAGVQANVLGDVLAVAIGLGVSAALILWLHPVLFGVSIWPIV